MSADFSGYANRQEGVLKTWHKRWLELKEGVLHCYKDRGQAETGQIVMNTTSAVTAAPDAKKSNCFKVVEGDKAHLFCTDTDKEMEDWIHVLDRVRQGLSPDPPEMEIVATADEYKRPVRRTRRTAPN